MKVDWELAKIIYENGETLAGVGKRFGVSGSWIRKNFVKMGFARRGHAYSQNLTLNHEAFATVTPESAYWIGFLMADGCVSDPLPKGSPRVSIRLKESDAAHLEKFSRFLGMVRPISIQKRKGGLGHGENLARVELNSKEIVGDLATYGVVPRKTGREKVIGLENNRDFWRGVVDGDGTIGAYSRGPMFSLCGSYDLLLQFSIYLQQFGCKLLPKPRDNYYTIGTTGYGAEKTIRELYVGAEVYLERKWEIAMKTLGIEVGPRILLEETDEQGRTDISA